MLRYNIPVPTGAQINAGSVIPASGDYGMGDRLDDAEFQMVVFSSSQEEEEK